MNRIGVLSVTLLALASTSLRAQEPGCTPITCVDQLFELNECQLKQLYAQGTCPDALCGYFDGYSLGRAGKPLAKPIAKCVHVVWNGKLFSDGCIINRWFKKLHFAPAAVCHGLSLHDGCPSLIMDYRGLSRIWSTQRDELRQVGPNVYLGMAYREHKGCMRYAQFFALERPCCCCE